MVCRSSCWSLCHSSEPCKNGEPIENAVWTVGLDGTKESCVRWGPQFFWERALLVKYTDFLPWDVKLRLNELICRLSCGLRRAKGSTSSVMFAMCFGATWRIRLNRLSAVVMQPYVKLLWPLVDFMDDVIFAHKHRQRDANMAYVQSDSPSKPQVGQHVERSLIALFLFWATVTSNGSPYAVGSLFCLSVTLVCCGQTVGWMKMPLGTEVGLGPGDIVLEGDPAPPSHGKGTAALLPHFLAHCSSTVTLLSNCWALVYFVLLENCCAHLLCNWLCCLLWHISPCESVSWFGYSWSYG